MARLAALTADAKKAREIVLYDVRKVSGVSDYCVIATVESAPHLTAVEEALDENIKSGLGINLLHREGRGKSGWLVMDYGGVVIHLFQEQARSFFGLECLWENARPLDWAAPPRSRKK